MAERSKIFRGDRLLELRNRRGLSQADLAQRLALGQNQVYRYENGIGEPAPAVIAKLAGELGASTDYLLGLVDNPESHLAEKELSVEEYQLLSAWRHGDFRELLRMAAEMTPKNGTE